ncbi:hypothetical protein T4B_2142 [Trichinella pseudospiralis]|uniref:Uncharacterized protein n=1 Tax=Trichinella pseudospiralis TaxID=6337 RepID=A0A0V1IWH8_TRIPS|nr:hypothetical protein T4B_2142 [Trichinella pseudospiralis]
MVVIVWKQSDIADLISNQSGSELVDFQSNKALAFFSRLFFWSLYSKDWKEYRRKRDWNQQRL